MQFLKNPNAFTIKIDNDYSVIVNPQYKYGVRLINKYQLRLFNLLPVLKTANNINEHIKLYKNDVTVLESVGAISEFGNFKKLESLEKCKNLNLWIQSTNKCNLKCKYCYINSADNECFTKDTFKILQKKLIENIRQERLESVRIRWAGGEPLLNNQILYDFIPSISQMKNKVPNCSINQTIITNGTIISSKHIEYIKNYNIDLNISLDGLGIFHDSNRAFINNKGSFDIIYSNILKLIKKEIFPSILIVLSNNNIKGLPELTHFILKNNLPFRYSIVDGQSIDKGVFIENLNKCYELCNKEIENGYANFHKHRFDELRFNNFSRYNCSAGVSGGAIYLNGDIYFCQKQFNISTPLGSIKEVDNINNIVMRGQNYHDFIDNRCDECMYKNVCNGGCPLEKENVLVNYCEIYKNVIPIIFFLRGKERLLRLQKISRILNDSSNE